MLRCPRAAGPRSTTLATAALAAATSVCLVTPARPQPAPPPSPASSHQGGSHEAGGPSEAARVHQLYARLEALLDLGDQELQERMDKPAPAARRALLEDFLASEGGGERTRSYRLRARARLATECLLAYDTDAAARHFTAILEEDPGPDEHEFRMRAHYGLAQTAELRGDLALASRRYRSLVEAEEGSRYAAFARAALARIQARGELRRGEPVTDLPARTDTDGQRHSLGQGDGRLRVLLFWSPVSPPSLRAMEAYRGALESFPSHGVAVLAVALGSSSQEAEAARRRMGFAWPLLCDGSDWLDPLALRLGVQRLPWAVLLGPRNEFIAAGLPPDRLADVLRRILGG